MKLFSFSRIMTLAMFLCINTEIVCGEEDLKFYSQCGQDSFLYKRFFHNKKDGVFVDIGAHDGIVLSNTYFFEKELGWKGICIEPLPDRFEQLRKNRKCTCIQGCIYNKTGTVKFLNVKSHIGEHTEMLSGIVETYDNRHLNRIKHETRNNMGSCEEVEVKCYLLNDVLSDNKIAHVDYLSIDTEGGELDILKAIDFDKYTINIIDVENNYNDPEFEKFLSSKGYKKFTNVSWDEIYVRKSWYENSLRFPDSV